MHRFREYSKFEVTGLFIMKLSFHHFLVHYTSGDLGASMKKKKKYMHSPSHRYIIIKGIYYHYTFPKPIFCVFPSLSPSFP